MRLFYRDCIVELALALHLNLNATTCRQFSQPDLKLHSRYLARKLGRRTKATGIDSFATKPS